MREKLSKEDKKKKWENFWYYYKYHVLVGAFLLFCVITFVRDMMSKVDYDYQIALMGKYAVLEEDKASMKKWFEEHGEDLNNDGEVHVAVVDYFLPEEDDLNFDPQIYAANQTKFMVDVQESDSMIYFLNTANHKKLEEMEVFPSEEEIVSVQDCAGFQEMGSPDFMKNMKITMRLLGNKKDKKTVNYYEKNKELIDMFIGDNLASDKIDVGEEKSEELMVFAAASMTETLTEIGELYREDNPNVEIHYNFDSSGTLKTQIQEGAECDLFISAGQKQMDQLDASADKEINTEGLDFVLEDSRKNILENKVTLCVSQGNENRIKTFDDLAEILRNENILLAMGNQDVPVGQYTQKILKYYDLDEEQLAKAGKISYGSNVKEVTTQVTEGSVDCGVIYCTDAYSAGLPVSDYATADMCGQVIYPAAVLKTGKNQEEAEKFLEFLQTKEAMDIFEGVGFSPVN